MSSTAPARIVWAVEQLDVQPDDRILEIGCGGGVAVALVAARLGGGCITAIDRSATAIERARRRKAGNGRAVFEQVDLAHFAGEPAAFDKAFAVNVNVFWTTRATAECAVLERVLRPGGVVRLVYDGTRDVGPAVASNLERHGFEVKVVRGEFLCVMAVV